MFVSFSCFGDRAIVIFPRDRRKTSPDLPAKVAENFLLQIFGKIFRPNSEVLEKLSYLFSCVKFFLRRAGTRTTIRNFSKKKKNQKRNPKSTENDETRERSSYGGAHARLRYISLHERRKCECGNANVQSEKPDARAAKTTTRILCTMRGSEERDWGEGDVEKGEKKTRPVRKISSTYVCGTATRKMCSSVRLSRITWSVTRDRNEGLTRLVRTATGDRGAKYAPIVGYSKKLWKLSPCAPTSGSRLADRQCYRHVSFVFA